MNDETMVVVVGCSIGAFLLVCAISVSCAFCAAERERARTVVAS